MLDNLLLILNYIVFSYNENTFTVADVLIFPLGILTSLWLVRVLIKKLTTRLKVKQKDPNIIQLVEKVIFIVSIAVIFMTTLSILKIPITAFAFLSGAIAIGFGFGAQNIINNFISGWILIGEKPIRIGDFLEIEGVKGIVEEINTRSTRIRRIDGVHMLVPNSKLIENTVVNWTLVDRQIRGSVVVGVQYGSDCQLVSRLMLEVTNAQEGVLDSPNSAVFFNDFADNALIFEVVFWINSTVDRGLRAVSSDIRFEIERVFKQEDLVIAYPQRDLHIDGELTVIRNSK